MQKYILCFDNAIGIALRDINIGDELTVDYSTFDEDWDDKLLNK